MGLVDLDQATLRGEPARQPRVRGEGERFHDVRHQTAKRADPVLTPVLIARRMAHRLGRTISATASRKRFSTRGRSNPAARAFENSLATWVRAWEDTSDPSIDSSGRSPVTLTRDERNAWTS